MRIFSVELHCNAAVQPGHFARFSKKMFSKILQFWSIFGEEEQREPLIYPKKHFIGKKKVIYARAPSALVRSVSLWTHGWMHFEAFCSLILGEFIFDEKFISSRKIVGIFHSHFCCFFEICLYMDKCPIRAREGWRLGDARRATGRRHTSDEHGWGLIKIWFEELEGFFCRVFAKSKTLHCTSTFH